MNCEFPMGKVNLSFPKKLQADGEMVWCGKWSVLLTSVLEA